MHERYAFGEFDLNAPERRLRRDGTHVPLAPKVFDVLLLLVRNAGHLLRQQDLLREVWNDAFVEEASVTRTMSTLRKTLGLQDSGEPYIETIPRTGYRFVASVARPMPAAAEPAIAVLPFKEIGDASPNCLGAGIADTLITRLSNVTEIIVRPSSAILRYDASSDPVAAGRELGVEFVVDGHLHCSDTRIRATVQMIRVGDGRPLWADTFDEEMTSLFAVEDSIARQVTSPENAEAHELDRGRSTLRRHARRRALRRHSRARGIRDGRGIRLVPEVGLEPT